MNDESHQASDRDLGKRIASLVRSIGRGAEKPIAGEELQRLKAAADRLDQMLKAAADADQQALKSAVDRLDRLLVEIRKGKNVAKNLKQRDHRESTP